MVFSPNQSHSPSNDIFTQGRDERENKRTREDGKTLEDGTLLCRSSVSGLQL